MTVEELGATRSAFSLTSGLKGVVFERPNAPVHVRLAFKAGYRFDPLNKEGTAHLLEHMITSGTKRYPTKTVFANYIERFGGNFSASTHLEGMYLNVTVGEPRDVEVAFDALSQMMTESLFDPATLENERQAVLGEIGNWQAQPLQVLHRAINDLVFAGTPCGRTLLGAQEAVPNIQTSELKAFLQNTLTADRGLVLVSGGINGQQIEELAYKHFMSLPQTAHEIADGELIIHRGDPIHIVHKENKQLFMSLGFRTTTINSRDNASLGLLATIMGGGRASSLSRILREEKGLVYTASTGCTLGMGGGYITTTTTADKDKLQQVVNEIFIEYQRLATSGPDQAEFDFALEKRIKSLRMGLQTSSAWVQFHCHQNLFKDSNWTVKDYLSELQALTCKDLQRVAATYFRPNNWYIAIVGDVECKDFEVSF